MRAFTAVAGETRELPLARLRRALEDFAGSGIRWGVSLREGQSGATSDYPRASRARDFAWQRPAGIIATAACFSNTLR
jgi:hypothetical protein